MHESLRNSNHGVTRRISTVSIPRAALYSPRAACHPCDLVSDGIHSRPHLRSGNISPKAIIAIVIFLAIFGALRLATKAPPDIKVVDMKRVHGKNLNGSMISMQQIKAILSSEATGGFAGISGLSAHFRTAPPGLREADGGEEPETQGTEGIDEKLVDIQPDANGEFLFVRIQLSRDYLEKQGKISNLMAVVSTPDIQLVRAGAGGGSVDPIFLYSGVREQTTTAKGTVTNFNFGGGNTYISTKPMPAELWLAAGQVKQAQELSGTVEVVCLFGKPPGDGELSLQILGTPNVPLQ